MRIFRSFDEAAVIKSPVVTTGTFDGVHIGHKTIIRRLKKLAADHADENFQVIGIAIDFRDKVLAYASEMKIDYPMLIGEQDALDAAAAFGVEAVGMPFTIFTDTSGRVIALHMGELTADEAFIILAAVRNVNAGRLDPVQARAAITTALAALPPQPKSDEKSGG